MTTYKNLLRVENWNEALTEMASTKDASTVAARSIGHHRESATLLWPTICCRWFFFWWLQYPTISFSTLKKSASRLSELTVPTLLLHGEDDKLVPVRESEKVFTDLRNHMGDHVQFIRIGRTILLFPGTFECKSQTCRYTGYLKHFVFPVTKHLYPRHTFRWMWTCAPSRGSNRDSFHFYMHIAVVYNCVCWLATVLKLIVIFI